MDTLWRKLGNRVEIKHTKKLFFGKYLYSVRIIIDDVCRLRNWDKPKFNIGETIRLLKEKNVDLCIDPERYNDLRTTYETLAHYKDTLNIEFKTAMCNYILHIYTNDSDMLYRLAQELPGKVTEYVRPDDNNADALIAGKVIVKTTHNYRIVTRETRLPYETRQSLLTYLQSSDTTTIHRGLIKSLNKPDVNWMPSTYFYTDDSSICTMISLIAPDFVRGIFPIAKDE